MTTYAEARDDILETLQHNGGWMTLSAVQAAAKVLSSAATYQALAELVGYQQVARRRRESHAEWKAIMERVR